MYICICNAIREDELVALARKHSGPPESLYSRLGFQPQCGECLNYADKVIAAARNLPEPRQAPKIPAFSLGKSLGLEGVAA